MFDLALFNADRTVRLASCVGISADDLVVRCNEHGYESVTVSIYGRLANQVNIPALPATTHVVLVDRRLYRLFEGRLEDAEVFSDETGSGVRLTAYGYQNAYRDVPYTALWSTQDVSQCRPIRESEIVFRADKKFDFDNTGRLFVSPKKATAYNAGEEGALAYFSPHLGGRQITRVSFDYSLAALGGNWRARLATFNEGFGSRLAEWSLTASGAIQTGSATVVFSSARDHFHIGLISDGVVPSFAGEDGTFPLVITNLRVTTATPTIHGGTIASALVDFVSSVNAGQVDTGKEYILSPGYDLTDEVYEDMYPADIFDKLIMLGDSQVPPRLWQWSVWEDKHLRFEPRGYSGRTWYVNAASVTINRTYSTLVNSAYAVHQDAAGETVRSATSTDAASLSRYGITKRQAVSASTSNAAQALVTRGAVLLDGKNPKPQITIAFNALFDQRGTRVPVYWVRPGDTVQVRNLSPVLARDNLASFRVLTTEYTNGTMTVTPESHTPTVDVLLARREERI